MTKKQEETCENCGRQEWEHPEINKSCKKFKPKSDLVPIELIDNLVEIDTDQPLGEGDVLTLEEECDELGN